MGFREVSVIEVREVLRAWLGGAGLRTVAERAGVDRKTARRYVLAAQEAGLERSAGLAAVDDALGKLEALHNARLDVPQRWLRPAAFTANCTSATDHDRAASAPTAANPVNASR